MPGRFTLTLIKPTAVEERLEGKIITIILEHGFHIRAWKKMRFTRLQAEAFYKVHKDKYFFHDLVSYMISGPVYAGILEKEDAVNEFRLLIGATDPGEAAAGTIRRMFGRSRRKNAIHGSDSDANAEYEMALLFSDKEWV
ncbi:MAG: nucleoside-diphosphate kinase [Bacteroidia bacterium]|jgi:nucleoside-diphosphate kinase|nr:nucleoside-diphosphate kinase [Bacteroidales bacterium]NCD42772.1 nucleoside-diphosphate kinase [Bacteroidia bacterium]MDD2322324.1 nucleoside-diphosphate kinase [Bacteroidales bacterium]MDD3009890.1 nucleoside-diphosphate kinase [Bacteroidales bacterium]MDD3961463.1 nucleoside-diphosphate kinase [Bacteroidales bacterium]